jgi:ketosteroid isomerase-like protein
VKRKFQHRNDRQRNQERPLNEIERNKQLAREFFHALERADMAAILDAYAEDGRVHTMGNTLISGVKDKAHIRQHAGGVLAAFPKGIRYEIRNITAEEDRVAVEADGFAIHASGKPYNNKYHFLMRYRDGKLVDLKEYMDTELATDVLCGGRRPE